MNELKQVIILRKDLNMRKGKMVAQGAHASAMIIRDIFDKMYLNNTSTFSFGAYADFRSWLYGLQTKICVGVDSESELHSAYHKALAAALPCSLVLDAGKTEFNEATYTAVAIGPAPADQIDVITGSLKLL